MLIASYNRPGMGDVLVTMVNNGSGEQTVTTKQNVTRLRTPRVSFWAITFKTPANCCRIWKDTGGK